MTMPESPAGDDKPKDENSNRSLDVSVGDIQFNPKFKEYLDDSIEESGAERQFTSYDVRWIQGKDFGFADIEGKRVFIHIDQVELTIEENRKRRQGIKPEKVYLDPQTVISGPKGYRLKDGTKAKSPTTHEYEEIYHDNQKADRSDVKVSAKVEELFQEALQEHYAEIREFLLGLADNNDLFDTDIAEISLRNGESFIISRKHLNEAMEVESDGLHNIKSYNYQISTPTILESNKTLPTYLRIEPASIEVNVKEFIGWDGVKTLVYDPHETHISFFTGSSEGLQRALFQSDKSRVHGKLWLPYQVGDGFEVLPGGYIVQPLVSETPVGNFKGYHIIFSEGGIYKDPLPGTQVVIPPEVIVQAQKDYYYSVTDGSPEQIEQLDYLLDPERLKELENLKTIQELYEWIGTIVERSPKAIRNYKLPFNSLNSLEKSTHFAKRAATGEYTAVRISETKGGEYLSNDERGYRVGPNRLFILLETGKHDGPKLDIELIEGSEIDRWTSANVEGLETARYPGKNNWPSHHDERNKIGLLGLMYLSSPQSSDGGILTDKINNKVLEIIREELIALLREEIGYLYGQIEKPDYNWLTYKPSVVLERFEWLYNKLQSNSSKSV